MDWESIKRQVIVGPIAMEAKNIPYEYITVSLWVTSQISDYTAGLLPYQSKGYK